MIKNLPLFLIPNGGLGNRLRVIDSGLRYHRNRKIIVINFKTNMFNINLNEIISFPINSVRVWNIRFYSDVVIRALLYLFFKVFSLIPGIQEYNTRKTSLRDNVICTCHELNCKYSYFTAVNLLLNEELRERLPGPIKSHMAILEATDYDAVHIRLGDNKRAFAKFDISQVKNFIRGSNRQVYLCSDNEEIINELREVFGKKIIIDDFPVGRSSEGDLIFAIYQIMMCVQSVNFLPSEGSSFSTTIKKLRAGKCI